MNYPIDYVPPKIWKWENENGGTFASTNRPIAGSTHDKTLPIGQHPFQLYSQGTPNGIKVTVMFEELLEMGHSDAEYDAWLISIGKGEQFGSDFVNINPNSKIPALLDNSGDEPKRVFESGLYFCILLKSLILFYRNTAINVQKFSIGFFGRCLVRRTLGVGLVIFMSMRQRKYSMQLIAIRWKLNVSLMFLIVNYQKKNL